MSLKIKIILDLVFLVLAGCALGYEAFHYHSLVCLWGWVMAITGALHIFACNVNELYQTKGN